MLIYFSFHRFVAEEDRADCIIEILRAENLKEVEPFFDEAEFVFCCGRNKELECRVFMNWKEKLHTCRFRDTPENLAPMSRRSKFPEVLEMTSDVSIAFLDIIIESIRTTGRIMHQEIKTTFMAKIAKFPESYFKIASSVDDDAAEHSAQNKLIGKEALLTKIQSLSDDVWVKAVELVVTQESAADEISNAHKEYKLTQPSEVSSLATIARIAEEAPDPETIAEFARLRGIDLSNDTTKSVNNFIICCVLCCDVLFGVVMCCWCCAVL